MKDVYWVAAAWKEASNDSLRKAWRNLLPEPEAEDDTVYVEDVDDLTVTAACLGPEAEWMNADVNEPGHQIMDDDEIVAEMVASEDDDEDESDEEESAADPSITPAEAFDALEITLRWLESQNTDADHLLLVKKWRDHAARMTIHHYSALPWMLSMMTIGCTVYIRTVHVIMH